MKKRFILVAAVVLLATLLIAGMAMADPLKGVTFAPATLTKDLENTPWWGFQISATDASADVKVTLDPAAPDPYTVKWSSSDTSVVTVLYPETNDFENAVYSSKPGKATIKAEVYESGYNGKYLTSASFTVEFKEIALTGFTQTVDKVDMDLGEGKDLYLTKYLTGKTPANATYDENTGLDWTSSDMTIVKIDSDGEAHAKKAGTATITAALKSDATKKWTFEVTVTEKELTGLKLNLTDAKIEIGGEDEYIYLRATKEPADASDTLKWTISDPSIAYLGNTTGTTNYVYPAKAGTTTVTVASKSNPSMKAECTVTVVENKITALKFSQTEFKMVMDEGTLNLWPYLDITPVDAIGNISWSSSDVTVAKADGSTITAVKPGTATITAFAEKDPTIKAEATITVEAINATAVAFTQSAIELEQGSGNFYPIDMLKVAPADASAKNITFSTSDRDCVTLDGEFGTGWYANPAKVGTSTITVTWKNWDDTVVTGTMTVTVKAPKIESFGFAKTEYSLTTSSKNLDLWRRLVIKPDNRKWLSVFPDDPDYLVWDSSDATVASVTDDGQVIPITPGTAEISVTYAHDETVTAKVTVTVTGTPVKKIALNRTKIEFSPYDTAKSGELKLSYQPANADIKEIYWTISDPTIAWLGGSPVANSTSSGVYDVKYLEVYPNENGKTGTTTITVFVDDGQTVHEATCEVSVAYPKADISLENAKVTLSLVKDKTYASNNQYSFYAWNTLLNNNPDDYEDEIDVRSFKWASSDKSVAKISKNGKITVLKKGKTTITGTYKKDASITVTCEVTVTQTKIKSISAIDRTIRVGQVIDLFGGKSSEGGDGWIVLLPKTTNTVRLFNPELKITSSKKTVVSIKNGKLSGLKPGTSKITVKAQDGSKKKTTFKVTVIDNTDVEFPEN